MTHQYAFWLLSNLSLGKTVQHYMVIFADTDIECMDLLVRELTNEDLEFNFVKIYYAFNEYRVIVKPKGSDEERVLRLNRVVGYDLTISIVPIKKLWEQ